MPKESCVAQRSNKTLDRGFTNLTARQFLLWKSKWRQISNMPLLEPEKKEKEGGGEEKGEEGGKEGEYWESCAEAARSLKTSLSRAKWLSRPSPAGLSRYQFTQACCLRYCKHCLILLAAKPGGVHLMHITQFTTIHFIQVNPTNATRHTAERTIILQY